MKLLSCQDIPQRCSCCSLSMSVQSVQLAGGLNVGALVGAHFQSAHAV